MYFSCLCGQLRNINDWLYNYYQYYHTYDLYVCTWKSNRHTRNKILALKPKVYIEYNYDKFIKSQSEKIQLIKSGRVECTVEHMLAKWFCVQKCFKSIEENYTHGIITRPELTYESTVQMQDGLNIPSGKDYQGINDNFAYGDFDSLKRYSLLYKNLEKFARDYCVFKAERLLRYHLTSICNMKINRTEYKIILRGYPWGGHKPEFIDTRHYGTVGAEFED